MKPSLSLICVCGYALVIWACAIADLPPLPDTAATETDGAGAERTSDTLSIDASESDAAIAAADAVQQTNVDTIGVEDAASDALSDGTEVVDSPQDAALNTDGQQDALLVEDGEPITDTVEEDASSVEDVAADTGASDVVVDAQDEPDPDITADASSEGNG